MDKRGLEQLKHGDTNPEKLARKETNAVRKRVRNTTSRINNLSSQVADTKEIARGMTTTHTSWIKVEEIDQDGRAVFARIKIFSDYEEGTESHGTEFAVGSTDPEDFFEEDGVDLEGKKVYINPLRKSSEPGVNINLPLASSRISDSRTEDMLRRIVTLNQSLDIIEPALDAIEGQQAISA